MKPWMMIACAGVALAPTLDRAALAGDLQPPAGQVASTMKPLDAVEPRVCLSDVQGDEGASHIVTSPGIYMLTEDLVGEQGKDGVRINCDAFPAGEHHVVIALQGFSMTGAAGSANAIIVNNSDPVNRRVHVTITGSVRDAPGNAIPGSLITGWTVDGVHVEGATSVSLSSVRIAGCLDDGFEATNLALGASVRCHTCVFERCGVDGVRVTLPSGDGSSLDFQEIESLHNTGHGARVIYAHGGQPSAGQSLLHARNMDLVGNGLDGFRVGISHDESISYDFDEMRCVGNGGDGVRVSVNRPAGSGGRMSISMLRCSSSGNVGDGFSCVVTNARPDRKHSVHMHRCSASENGGDGVSMVSLVSTLPLRGTLHQHRSSGNGGHGVRMESADASMDVFVCEDNSGAGVFVRRGHVRCSDGTCRRNSLSGIDVDNNNESCDVELYEMACSDNGGDGVRVSRARRLSVDNSSCVGNGTGPTAGAGLSADNTITCSCTHLIAADNGGGGAVFVTCARVRADSCDMYGNSADGLRCVGGESLHATGCDASSNLGGGIVVDVSREGRLHDVVCSSNGAAGISFSSAMGLGCGRATLERCVANDNVGSGVDLSCTAGGSIRRCEASSNGGDGFAVSGPGHVVVENIASSNVLVGYQITPQGNSLGPITDEAKVPTNTNPGANYLR